MPGTVATMSSFSDDNDKNSNNTKGHQQAMTASTATKSVELPIVGAEIPNGHAVWSFYNPRPTRISRPKHEDTSKEETTTATTTTAILSNDEWKDFFDSVDSILEPVNQTRRLVCVLTISSVTVPLVFLVGMFTFAQGIWSENVIYMAIYLAFGFSILPLLLLLTVRWIIPGRVKKMKHLLVLLCQDESERRVTTCKTIRFVKNDDDNGCYIEVLVLSSEVPV